MNTFISIGDYCLVQRKYDIADTIVVFSALNTPKGKFRFTKALAEFDGNVIYLNSKKGNDWYTEGIEDLGEDYRSTAIAIKNLICQYSGNGERKVITIGGSMGAYAAVLYGALIDADYSIACGTELITNLFRGRSVHVTKKIPIDVLNKIIHDSQCTHHMIAGNKDPVDMLNYSYFKYNPQMKWYIFESQPHQVIQYIHKKYTILQLINWIIASASLHFEETDIVVNKHDHVDYINDYVMLAVNNLYSDFKINDHTRIFLKNLEKAGYHSTIVKLLENENLQEYLWVQFLYLKSLIRTENLKQAREIHNDLKKTKIAEKVSQFLKRNDVIL